VTRINVFAPADLTDEHLLAAWDRITAALLDAIEAECGAMLAELATDTSSRA
jgi:hypothetical protein